MTDTTTTQLSPAGQARRDAMLATLQRQVAARGRRRIALRAAAGAAAVLILGATATIAIGLATRRPMPSLPAPIAEAPQPPVIEPAIPSLVGPLIAVADRHIGSTSIQRLDPIDAGLIQPLRADGDLLARSRYRGQAVIPAADDQELATALRAAGKNVGVVRTPDGVLLVPDVAPAAAG